MKKKTLVLLILVISFADVALSQNFNWITPNKTYLKLFVNDDGIYRINKSDFTGAGVSTTGLDPRTVKVLYKGNQIPVYFSGEDDGTFDDNDFLDFYGERNYGGPTKHLDANSNTNLYTTNEYYNLFSDTSVYWVDWGGSNGLRMSRSTYNAQENFPNNYHLKKLHFETDVFYYLGETRNPNSDFRYFSTERVAGEGWFWKSITADDNTFTQSALINDLVVSSQLCTLKLFAYTVSFTDSVFNEHRLEIKINNTIVDTLFANNLTRIDESVIFPSNILTNGTDNVITIRYIPIGNTFFYPVVFLDYVSLQYPAELKLTGNNLRASLTLQDTVSRKITVAGVNGASPINIYDVRNNIRIENFSTAGTNLLFTGKSNSKFEVVNQAITKKPFRISSRQVPNLVSANNGADYMIVYHRLFESQAEQLRSHRQSNDSYRSFKAEIQDIYDIFNFGLEDPIAVRNFMSYANSNWSKPAPQFLCLFGRASLDPKKNISGSQYSVNFVPTYGNPPTDGYFVNYNFGTFTYYHQISVGRIPVYTVAEAQASVDKIIAYDQLSPQVWWKKFLSITGGGTRQEQQSFQQKSELLINSFIKPPPPSMNVERIYRSDSAGYITYNYKDSIKKEFDRGTQIVNFIGHAAAQDWEIGLEDPNTLNNGPRQPLVLSMTCFTGKTSEPNLRSFGEKFFIIPNKCAIGFVGTTGWSFSGIGDQFNGLMLKTFAQDSTRPIGEMVTYASQQISSDSLSFASRNTINCYNLIGDPATKLKISNTPEFDIRENDYVLSNPFPALRETIALSVYPRNLGTFADSVKLRFNLKKEGVTISRKDTLIRSFSYIDTLTHFFSVDSNGSYAMTVVIDPDRRYQQKFTNNDSITIPLTLRNLSYTPIRPLNNALLKSASFRFTGLNPNIDVATNNVKVILQIDTTRLFNSPVSQTFNTSTFTGISTGFDVNLPVTETNTLYYLRTNALINNDSSGWSETRNLIYNPGAGDEIVSDSAYTIYTARREQFGLQNLVNVRATENGFELGSFTGNLYAKSYGSNGPEASYFTINNINYYSDGGSNVGLNIAKIKKLTGQVPEIRHFRMNTAASSDSVLAFLNTFDTTHYIMTYIASYVPDSDSMRSNAKAKFREFGSTQIDSVRRFDQFDTWVFFGYLGAQPGDACDRFHRFTSNFVWTPLDCQLTPQFSQTLGTITQTFGNADAWRNFSWEQTVTSGNNISFDIFGLSRDNNQPVALASGITSNQFVSIDTIDSYAYPSIRLDAKLSIDTLNGQNSPVFKSTSVRYVPPAEIAPDNYSFTASDTMVQEGDSLSFSVNYYNIGFKDVQQYVNKWYVKNQGIETVLRTDTISNALLIDSGRTSSVSFSTSGLRDIKIKIDTMDLYFETSLIGNANELFPFNNTAITSFIVEGDTVNPLIEVTYDGKQILNGDYVQKNPVVMLKFFDDSRMVISDTSNVKVFLDNRYVPYVINGMPNPELEIEFPDNMFLQALVTYKPNLAPGQRRLRFIATDNTGNFADSIVNTVVVNTDMSIIDMANYPNPMKTETNFMFNLSGEFNPTSCRVKIFTTAGRLIKTIDAPANVGYNSIYWDGKDDDGDFIANGTYLYKFIIQGNSQIETSIQKLAVLR